MEAFLASFLVVFLAELGDKTQFIVMAFTAKYRWQSVFAGLASLSSIRWRLQWDPWRGS